MKKFRVYDYCHWWFDLEQHKQSIDAYTFIMARALSIFEGAKKEFDALIEGRNKVVSGRIQKNHDSEPGEEIAKRVSLWNNSQQVALIRAKWDQPISIVRQLLNFCTSESLEKNKRHILDYFVKCYDWMDLAVAMRVYESVVYPERAYIMNSISFDRHYNNNRQRYSDGRSGKAYLTINMLDDLTMSDLTFYLKECFDIIYSDNLPKPKKKEASPQLLRGILARNMRYLYDIKPKELIELINYCYCELDNDTSKVLISIPTEIDGKNNSYMEQDASNDFRKFNNDMKNDWFRNAIETFELDRTRNWEIYQDHYISIMVNNSTPFLIPPNTNLAMLDDPIYVSQSEQMKRFELKFNCKQSLFSLEKSKI